MLIPPPFFANPTRSFTGGYGKDNPYRASIRALHVQRSWLSVFSVGNGEGTRRLSVPGRSHTSRFAGSLGTSHSGVDGQGGSPKKRWLEKAAPTQANGFSPSQNSGVPLSPNLSSRRTSTPAEKGLALSLHGKHRWPVCGPRCTRKSVFGPWNVFGSNGSAGTFSHSDRIEPPTLQPA